MWVIHPTRMGWDGMGGERRGPEPIPEDTGIQEVLNVWRERS